MAVPWALGARSRSPHASLPFSGTRNVAEAALLMEAILSAFPEGLGFTVKAMTAEGDRVAIEAESFGRHVSGRTYNNQYHFLMVIRDGKVRELKEYFDTRMTAVEKATILAAKTLEKRLEGMNEFRDTLRDQAARFVTREELRAETDKLVIEITANKDWRNKMEGKASAQSVYVAYAISILGLVIGLVGLLTH